MMKIWSIANGKVLRTLIGHKEDVRCVCISSDEKIIISGSWDCTIKIWSILSG